jgi:hypothetical protein
LSGIDISSYHWFLLVARPNRVFKAAAALQERGLVTALPFEWRSRRRARHCKSVLRLPLPQLGPYLMTGFAGRPHFRELLEDRILEPLLAGVVSVTSDGMPTPDQGEGDRAAAGASRCQPVRTPAEKRRRQSR